MEFRVDEFDLPKVIGCNADELKAELTEKVKHYETLVYTDDQIKEAKTDRATLNKLADAIDSQRKAIKKEYMKPYEAFESQVKELIAVVKKPIGIIDEQIKEFEAQQKLEKKEKIFNAFADLKKEAPENARFIAFSQIFNESWCNSSVSMKSIKDEITGIFSRASENVATLETLPEFSFEAVELYKQTLDMSRAIQEAKRMSDMQKAKAEAEAKKAEYANTQAEKLVEMANKIHEESAPFEEDRNWISFKAYLTTSDAVALRDFFMNRGIKFESI